MKKILGYLLISLAFVIMLLGMVLKVGVVMALFYVVISATLGSLIIGGAALINHE